MCRGRVCRVQNRVQIPQEIGNDLANPVAEKLRKLGNNHIKVHVE